MVCFFFTYVSYTSVVVNANCPLRHFENVAAFLYNVIILPTILFLPCSFFVNIFPATFYYAAGFSQGE